MRDDFHDTISGLVKSAGGEYKRGPTKLRERCVEKASREYDGDVCRVVDVERATALFTTVSALHEGLRKLSRLKDAAGDLEVVRVKDSFGDPKPSGWRCVYFSLRHAPSGLVAACGCYSLPAGGRAGGRGRRVAGGFSAVSVAFYFYLGRRQSERERKKKEREREHKAFWTGFPWSVRLHVGVMGCSVITVI